MSNTRSISLRVQEVLTRSTENQESNFPVLLDFGDATLRLFVVPIANTDRTLAQKEVDAVYQRIVQTRKTYPFVLDDYLVLIRSGDAVALLDEELARDSRVCRTLVWHSSAEAIDVFLKRTPFAALPDDLRSQVAPEEGTDEMFAGLSGFTADLSVELRKWVELAAREDFLDLEAKDLLNAISTDMSPMSLVFKDGANEFSSRGQSPSKDEGAQERFL